MKVGGLLKKTTNITCYFTMTAMISKKPKVKLCDRNIVNISKVWMFVVFFNKPPTFIGRFFTFKLVKSKQRFYQKICRIGEKKVYFPP